MTFARAFAVLSAAALGACARPPSPAATPAAEPPPAAAAPSTAASAEPPMYRAVHMDHIATAKLAQFEDARHTFLGVLAREKTSDYRGTYLQVGDSAFFSFRSFSTYAELDALRAVRIKASEAIPKADGEAYDERSDTALVPPHATEIWRRDPDYDYRAPGDALTELTAPFSRLAIEQLRTSAADDGADYDASWKVVAAALARAKYPLSRVAFFSSYGSGKLVTFWVAKSKEALDGAPSVDDAVKAALGDAQGTEAMRRLRECVVSSETYDVRARPDMNSPPDPSS